MLFKQKKRVIDKQPETRLLLHLTEKLFHIYIHVIYSVNLHIYTYFTQIPHC